MDVEVVLRIIEIFPKNNGLLKDLKESGLKKLPFLKVFSFKYEEFLILR